MKERRKDFTDPNILCCLTSVTRIGFNIIDSNLLRCGWVFERKSLDPLIAIDITNKALHEFWSANDLWEPGQKLVATKTTVQWRKPPANVVKINCNGAFCRDLQVGGWGIICRDDNSQFLRSWAERFTVDTAFYAELRTLSKAVEPADFWDQSLIIIELDCRELYMPVHSRTFVNCHWKYHGLLLDIFDMLKTPSMLTFSIIPREGNHAADYLAALASRESGVSRCQPVHGRRRTGGH